MWWRTEFYATCDSVPSPNAGYGVRPIRLCRQILDDNLLFILILNVPKHVPPHILYHRLCYLMQIPFLSKFWTTLFGIERFRAKCYVSDSVTRINDSTRVTIFGDSDSSHVEKNGDSNRVTLSLTFFTEWLVSSHSQWLETQSHFYKISLVPDGQTQFVCTQRNEEFLLEWWSRSGGNFLFCLSGRAILHFKNQVSPICAEGDLRLCFHWGVSRD